MSWPGTLELLLFCQPTNPTCFSRLPVQQLIKLPSPNYCLNIVIGPRVVGTTFKFPEFSGPHLINLGRMKGWVDLGVTKWFWTGDPWIGKLAPYIPTKTKRRIFLKCFDKNLFWFYIFRLQHIVIWLLLYHTFSDCQKWFLTLIK